MKKTVRQNKTDMVVRCAVACVCIVLLAPSLARPPRHGAFVVKIFAEPDDTGARQNRCCTTGRLHIQYSDGREIVQNLRDPGNHFPDARQAGFSDMHIAADRQAVGWTEDYYANASYPYPAALVLFRNGRIIFRDSGPMVWNWRFLRGGQQAVAEWGTAHGANCPQRFSLYDLATGKISTRGPDQLKEPCLYPTAPKWALQAEEDHNP